MNFIILFGGASFEHEISVVSAITLKKELRNISHFVFIDAENEAFLIPQNAMKSTHFSSGAYKNDARLSFTKGGFAKKSLFKSEILRGVVVNLIHGKSGEDGQIAGILDFYEIPFIGPRIEASAISFSKELTKLYAKSLGVKVLEYKIAESNKTLADSAKNAESNAKSQNLAKIAESANCPSLRTSEASVAIHKICEQSEANIHKTDSWIASANQNLPRNDKTEADSAKNAESSAKFSAESNKNGADSATFPCIVKPAHLGSSIGIAVAKTMDDFSYALDSAFEFDSRVIIEAFFPHIREFNLAGCKINGEFVFSIIEEVKKDELFAFEDKYLDFQGDGAKKKEADLSAEMAEKIKENFKAIYENCFEGAIIRCDFFMLQNEIYLNEINPIPGSMAHYLFDDFNAVVQNLAQNLPQSQKIKIKYQYISKIQAQKGK
ncbi:hypothetical protein ACWIUD_00100 [Helicobacter sp. 23-1044]